MRTGYGGGFLYMPRREDDEDEDEDDDDDIDEERAVAWWRFPRRVDAADNFVVVVSNVDIVP
jgi:hypothetical protein